MRAVHLPVFLSCILLGSAHVNLCDRAAVLAPPLVLRPSGHRQNFDCSRPLPGAVDVTLRLCMHYRSLMNEMGDKRETKEVMMLSDFGGVVLSYLFLVDLRASSA